MKKLLFITFVLYASFFAHSQTENNKYLEVTGEVVYEKIPEKYMAEIVISKDLFYGSDSGTITFEELREQFLKKLEENGIDQNKLVENQLNYLTIGYRYKGTVYKFTTTNKEEFKKFLALKSNGMDFRNRMATYKELSAKESKELMQKALKKARLRAKEYAEITNKKIGEILFIKDHNFTNTSPENFYYTTNYTNYKVTVAYSLK